MAKANKKRATKKRPATRRQAKQPLTVGSGFRFVAADESESDRPTIYIYDDIGPAWWGAIDASEIRDALDECDGADEIDLRINSNGGDVFEAAAMFNLFRDFPGVVNVKIDGLAASAASVVAMAGDEIVIADNAMIMIHDASTIAYGNKSEFAKVQGLLEQVDETIVTTYTARTGLDAEAIREFMAAETWFRADEAIENGFADKKSSSVSNVAIRVSSRFEHAPEGVEIVEDTRAPLRMATPQTPSAGVTPTPAIAAKTSASGGGEGEQSGAATWRGKSVTDRLGELSPAVKS